MNGPTVCAFHLRFPGDAGFRVSVEVFWRLAGLSAVGGERIVLAGTTTPITYIKHVALSRAMPSPMVSTLVGNNGIIGGVLSYVDYLHAQ